MPLFGLLLLGLWSWRDGRGLWPFVVAVGLLHGAVGRWTAERSCAALLPEGNLRGRVLLLDPIFPDARSGRVRLIDGGCAAEVDSRFPRSLALPAGTVVGIEGRWIPRAGAIHPGDGTLLVLEVRDASPPAGKDVASRLGEEIRALYGARAGVVEALVTNRRGAMSPELKNRYARSGLVHLLSISGFHVGIIAAWALLLLRLVGLPSRRAQLVAALMASGYVLWLGWPPPAARAALLVLLVVQAHRRQRNPLAGPLLAMVCLLLLLLDPWAVFAAGAWLSAAALAGALAASRWSDRALGTQWWWRMLASSVGATLATAPISAAMFGSVSLVGIGLNFLAIPLAALAVPGVFLSLLLAPLAPPLGASLAAASGSLLGLLDTLAWWGGQSSFGVVVQPAEPWSAVPWIVGLLLAGWSISGGTTRWEAARRWGVVAALAAWGGAGLNAFRTLHDASSGLALHFLDVGQGDACLLRTPLGHWILIDAGPRTDSWDAGRQVVVPFLSAHGVARLDLAVVSHPHADHLGGLPTVLDEVPVGQVLEPADFTADPLYTGVLAQLAVDSIPWRPARDGLTFVLDDVRFTVLHPDTAWADWGLDLNEDSAVLLVEYGRFRALFPGDAGLPAEARLAGRIGAVSLLKVGHHGSRSATGDGWLTELAPAVAVISSGSGNRYGHPHAEILERLAAHGVRLHRTDREGTIHVTTDGRTLEVGGGWHRETLELPAARPCGAPNQERDAC